MVLNIYRSLNGLKLLKKIYGHYKPNIMLFRIIQQRLLCCNIQNTSGYKTLQYSKKVHWQQGGYEEWKLFKTTT